MPSLFADFTDIFWIDLFSEACKHWYRVVPQTPVSTEWASQLAYAMTFQKMNTFMGHMWIFQPKVFSYRAITVHLWPHQIYPYFKN